jgi:tetratricopeptide (TPR) repeat protein
MSQKLQWLQGLDNNLRARQLQDGFNTLTYYTDETFEANKTDRGATGLLVRLAQWVDLGFRDTAWLKRLLSAVPQARRSSMTICEFLELKTTEGFCAMDAEKLDEAIALFDFVLRAELELANVRHAAITHFWKGRAHRKKGEYDAARYHIVRAREMMQQISEPKLAAVIQIQEAWLLFQKGESGEALRLLDEARAQLEYTDDDLSLGNIESAKGRIAQQAGRYEEALKHFDAAVELYGARNPNHRNLARALVNAATVKRAIALRLRKRIDARTAERQGSAARDSTGRLLSSYAQICNDALEQLRQAGEIYAKHKYFGGIASALVSSGYLHLDSGNIELGAREGKNAYDLAHDKNDHIHMARARTLQSLTENTRVDEQFGEDADVAVFAAEAKGYAEEAIHWAELTQNRRLAAEAYVARGMVHANDYFQEWEDAKRCVDRATALLGAGDHDYVWDELMALKARILRASSIDETLRAWSDGIVGEKTFQQIAEEFAEIVIPKVWQREGKKISRVAQKLGMSPKKVRRILRNVGEVH